jgi:malate dehydrogenase
MVYTFHKLTGFPKNQVVGMAGTLDTARYRAFLSMELGVSVTDIAGTVLGGHGPTMVPLPRLTTVGGVPLTDIADQDLIDRVVDRTRKAGTEIVQLFGKGSAFFSPAWSAIVIAESYLKDKNRVLPCAALCEGEYDINGLFIGVPCQINAKGVDKILQITLTDEEKEQLAVTKDKVQATVEECNV